MTLFDPSQVEKALLGLEGQSSNTEGLRRVYRKMLETAPQRWVSKPASAAPLEQVIEDCPNFRGVLEDLSNHIELGVRNKRGLALIPILLAGEPGVGKTHFAKRLAVSLGLSYQFLSMGTMSAGWILGGSAPTWSGARHGKIAASLIDGEFGNPLYLLDEIDKTGGSRDHDPMSQLLTLLERDVTQYTAHYEMLRAQVNGELANTPVNIIERQQRNLICSESEARKQQQDRVVSASNGSMPVTAVEHGLNLVGQQIGRKRCELPRSHTWYAACKIGGNITSVLQKAHERANCRAHMFRGLRTMVSCMTFDECHDVRTGHASDLRIGRKAALPQKLPSERDMANGRHARQSALPDQISVKILHNLFELVQCERWLGRNCIDLSK
ncbi:AAA family ATPase [Caballeronia jiangsuensis]|uniref:AAA family ATPase n=1 Tax=Caballeronia jiangsuensis TaxID=1458357 RepID=A0ABW9D0U3_9BURK